MYLSVCLSLFTHIHPFTNSPKSTPTPLGTTGKALPRLFRALLTHPLQLWALACITHPDPRFRGPLAASPWASLVHLRYGRR